MSKDKIIGTSGNKRNLLVFSLSEYEGIPTFDVRKYYTDRNSGEIKPTRKGITLTHKTFEVLRNVIEEKGESISDWLAMDDEFHDQVRAEVWGREDAEKAVRYQANDYLVDSSTWKSPEFFKVIGEGARDCLVYNSNHPLYTILETLKENAEHEDSGTMDGKVVHSLIGVFEKLLLSFGRTKSLYDDGPTGEMNMVLDSLAINWGIILKNYLDAI